jgi:peroxiredoxin
VGGGVALATTPVGPGTDDPTAFPEPTQYVIGAQTPGLQPGQLAPELSVTRSDGTPVQLMDLDGRPVRLADLRGKLVWLNFWASWCPPCQAETPILREMDEAYRHRGLAIVGIAVQETTVDDVRRYAERYELDYAIAFDTSADIFRAYQVWGLPTQFFIDEHGRVLEVAAVIPNEASARARIEAWLPKGS